MTIVISGINGFLGSALCEHLLQNDIHVIGIVRKTSQLTRLDKIKLNPLFRLSYVEDGLDQAFEQKNIFCVIHTATNYGRDNESPLEVFEANEMFALNLLQTASRYKVHSFINTDTVLPDNINYYSVSKSNFRKWGEIYAQNKLIRFVNIRLQYLYGIGETQGGFISFMVNELLKKEKEIKLSPGEQCRDFIYVADVVSAYLAIVNKMNEFNDFFTEIEVGSGDSIRLKDLALLIRNLCNNAETTLLFGALEYRPNEIMKTQANITYLNQLGWRPSFSLQDGIKECIKAYKK